MISAIRSATRTMMPAWVLGMFWSIKGGRPLRTRECPICGFIGTFRTYGRPPRIDAMCKCGSLERHRLFWMWLADARIQEPVLHFAPEQVLERRLRERLKDYRTADLFKRADLTLNLEQIQLNDSSVSTIICNHVLEHVDDVKALSEMFRVLKPTGQLIVSLPLIEGWDQTYEDASVKTEDGRWAHFGQGDHVRYYGRDFRARLEAPGFVVSEFTADGASSVRFGLIRGEKVFLCTKPA